jgi:predicted nucleotidyltransferase
MTDTFDKEIEKIICPMGDLGPSVLDATYFLKDTGSFVYTEGYWHPPGHIYGKIISYPCEKGTFLVHGRKYESITKGWEAGERILIPHDKQIEHHYKVDHSLKPPKEKPVLTEFHYPFDLSAMKGWFDAHKSMRHAMEKYPHVDKCIRDVSALLDVPLERLGVTGSLAYGRMEDDEDIDLVFFGTPEQNMEVAQQVWRLTYTDPKRRCVEFGKFWPLRFYHDGIIMCCFFVYADRKYIPVYDQKVSLVREPVVIYGTISDNLHSIYMPLVMRLSDAYIDGERADDIDLIIYDGSIRGEFHVKERIHVIKGRLVTLGEGGKQRNAIVVVDAGDVEKERFVKGAPLF